MKFTVPGTLPSFNEIIDVSKKHWSEYARMKKQYTDLVALCCRHIRQMQRVELDIVWYCPNKRMDPDGVMAGQKFILDGLVVAGKLPNDGWRQIRSIRHHFAIDAQKPRVEVLLTEVAG